MHPITGAVSLLGAGEATYPKEGAAVRLCFYPALLLHKYGVLLRVAPTILRITTTLKGSKSSDAG